MSKSVLIVDDSMVMRRLIGDTLSKSGFNIVGQAKNGEEAVNLYKKFRPDLVTMDIIMPGETGIEVVKRIKSLDQSARVLMVTGLNQKKLVIQAMQNGATEYIVKPFDKEQLVKAATKIAR